MGLIYITTIKGITKYFNISLVIAIFSLSLYILAYGVKNLFLYFYLRFLLLGEILFTI